MCFTGVSFSNFLYVDNIGNYWMVSIKSSCSLVFLPFEPEIQQTIFSLSNKN